MAEAQDGDGVKLPRVKLPRWRAARKDRPRPALPAPGARGAALVAVILIVTAVVAVVAFTGSYQHQYEINIRYGQAHWVAGMQPLSVEGLIAASTLAIWYAASVFSLRAWQVWGAYLMLGAGIAQTALMNLAADHRYNWPWLGPEISIWPAVAFVASYEMAVWIVRKRQERAGAGDPASPLPGSVPAPVPSDAQDAALMALKATAAAGNPLSGRQLETRFGLTRGEATRLRELVIASPNGQAPPET